MYITYVQESLQFPDEEDFQLSVEFQDLIRKLCSDSASRLGFDQIKEHSFFTGVDWDHLLDGEPVSLYIIIYSGTDFMETVFYLDTHDIIILWMMIVITREILKLLVKYVNHTMPNTRTLLYHYYYQTP